MSRIFLSHSSVNNAEALAVRNWMKSEGWDDVFLDIDPKSGLVSGEQWEMALREAAARCESVLFLISRAWLDSDWCRDEFNLARHLNKRLFGVLIEDLPLADLPDTMTREWQVTNIAVGESRLEFPVEVPPEPRREVVSLAADGLDRLRIGLVHAGLDPKYFEWPPKDDPRRPPYRGLKPLEAGDAGIFFGRDGSIVEAMDWIRGARDAAPPRFLVILGASGAGKSSFMRAGLLPRLARDNRHFVTLPVIRPGRNVMDGETGLVAGLEHALNEAGLNLTRAKIREAVGGGGETLRRILAELVEASKSVTGAGEAAETRPPTLILPVDQGEELFLAKSAEKGERFLGLLRDLASEDDPALAVLFTIRTDNYEALQTAAPLEGIRQWTFSLRQMPMGSFQNVIDGPARRLAGTDRSLAVEEQLVKKLLTDIEKGAAKDALPLLAFTLERLYLEHGGDGDLTLEEYKALGGIEGSIEAAVDQSLKAADADPEIPQDRQKRLALLRRAMIPRLAGIDKDTAEPQRRVARLSEIPEEARPLIELLVDQHLLVADIRDRTGEPTVEPAHEALLRQWSLLKGWLVEDAGLLAELDGVKRASREWTENDRKAAWLTHTAGRLRAAERLEQREDLAADLDPAEVDYLEACRKIERRSAWLRRGGYAIVAAVFVGIGAILTWDYWKTPADVTAHWGLNLVKSVVRPEAPSRDCSFCPEMVVLPTGDFMMGSLEDERGHVPDEGPRRKVTISRPFAVGRFEVTFDQWDACVAHGRCALQPSDEGWGRGDRPVIRVSWKDAEQYVKWLSGVTGRKYRLLSEAEWEYAARGATSTDVPSTRFSWGDEDPVCTKGAVNAAVFGECEGEGTKPVGFSAPNAFGLYDMHGNVWEWVEDVWHDNYEDAPEDERAREEGPDRDRRVLRGGSWLYDPENLRSADRDWDDTDNRRSNVGFRVGRTLNP